MAAARVLAAKNPTMVFVYVSGMGTDSTERGRSIARAMLHVAARPRDGGGGVVTTRDIDALAAEAAS